MKLTRFVLIAAGAATLAGCVSLGLSQQDSETGYTLAATAADVFLLSGKANADSAGQVCLGDTVNYRTLAATRNVADGVNYAPADAAHKVLQSDGAKLAPVQCVPPT